MQLIEHFFTVHCASGRSPDVDSNSISLEISNTRRHSLSEPILVNHVGRAALAGSGIEL